MLVTDLASSVLERLSGVTRQGSGWLAHCPAHEDRRQSLSVSLGRDGRLLLNCHAGCEAEAVVHAMDLEMRDLFPPREEAGPPRSRITETYDYVAADGTLLYQVVRKEPKDFRQRRPDGQGGWLWNLKGVDRVLYRLPAVQQAVAIGQLVFLVEGEKDVHTLERAGFVATTAAQGAGKWLPAYSEMLRGARVVLIPDRDAPGEAHMAEVAAALAGCAREVRLVALTDLPPKGDVSDWFGDGHTATELKQLVRKATAPARAHAAASSEAPPPPAPPEADDDTWAPSAFKLTDLGNGERLASAHGGDLRYVSQLRRWYVWDGRRWARDSTRQVERLAKSVVREIPGEADHAATDSLKTAIRGWATKSEARPRVMAMIACAEAEPHIAIVQSALDASPWLLALENGVLDLETGALRPHRREDLITHLVPITYTTEASCPRWLAFLARVMDRNAELIAFLQRAMGYSLTGSTREQVLFFLHGSGSNGKSTFLEILRALVGEYTVQADFATFLERRGDGPRNDVARLVGARVVTSSEVGEGKRLDESLVKSLTGSDTIAARLLYSEAFEFRPQFKLWLAANHKPVIRGTDQAIWRRVRLIPFTVEIPPAERDPDLVDVLKRELPGILAWAMQGCRDWLEYGLEAPEEVMLATEEYRRESDVLGRFLEEKCVMAAQVETLAGALYQAYRDWATTGGEFVLSQTAFGRRLTERGIQSEKRGRDSLAVRVGVGLLDSGDGREATRDRHEPTPSQEDFL